MNCMKCGRELEAGEAFCPVCQERMKQRPVKPGIAVLLPHREDPRNAKKQPPRKRMISPDEQISLLKKHNRRLAYLLIVCIVIIAMLGVISGHVVKQLGIQKLLGQNYSTIVQTEPVTESTGETGDETVVPST